MIISYENSLEKQFLDTCKSESLIFQMQKKRQEGGKTELPV